jgi:hypothetical protein
MVGLVLGLLDIAGTMVRIDVRLQSDTIELWCRTHLLGAFDRDHLLKWLDDPIDQISNRNVSWVSTEGGVVLNVGILFISCPVAYHDLESMKAYISAGRRLNNSPEQPSSGGTGADASLGLRPDHPLTWIIPVLIGGAVVLGVAWGKVLQLRRPGLSGMRSRAGTHLMTRRAPQTVGPAVASLHPSPVSPSTIARRLQGMWGQ